MLKIKPFFKDLILTFAVQLLVLLAFFFLYRIVAQLYGPSGVGEYSLIKKAVNFLQLILFLGLEIGLPRYIAMSDGFKRGTYFLLGTGVAMGLTCVFLIFANIYPDLFSELIFGSSDYEELVFPLSTFLFGLNLTALVYCYLQGRLMFRQFNVFQVVNMALIPMVIILVFNNSLSAAIMLTGIAITVTSLLFFALALNDLHGNRVGSNVRSQLKELMIYSGPRFAGNFFLAGLWSLSPIFAAHAASVIQAGYLAVGQSFVMVMSSLATPFGTLLLPKTSNLIADGRQESIKENISHFISAIIQSAVFICVQLIIFADLVIRFWLGSDYSAAVSFMRVSVFAAGFYFFYASSRSIIDAAKTKPINSINLFVSFVIFLVINGAALIIPGHFNKLEAINMAFAVSLVCLGILTYLSLKNIYPGCGSFDYKAVLRVAGSNIALALLALAVKPFIGSIYLLAVFEAVLSITYLFILFRFKSPWIMQALGFVLKDMSHIK